MAEITSYTETSKKYLDLNGLGYYDAKLKAWVTSQMSTNNGNYYTKEAADNKFATIANFDAYKTSNDNALAGVKASAEYAETLWKAFLGGLTQAAPTLGELATKNELSTGLSGKVDVTTYNTWLTDTYAVDKSALETSIGQKLAIETYNADKATFATKNELNEGLAAKVNTADYNADKATFATKNELNEGLAAKVNTADYTTDKTNLENAIDSKVAKSDYDTAIGGINTALGQKLAIETYEADKATFALKSTVEGIDGRLTTAEGKIEALSNATYFKGVTVKEDGVIENGSSNIPASIYGDGATPKAGDVIVSGNKEFIWDGAKWIELGDTTAELTAIDNNAKAIEALQGTVGEHTTAIGNNASAIEALQGTVGEHTTAIGDNANAIAALQGTVGEHTTAIGNNATNISANTKAIDDLTKTVGDNKTAVDNALLNYVKYEDYIKASEIDALFA